MPDYIDLGHHRLFRPADLLYRWILPTDLQDGLVLPSHCPTKQWREGLSCDWSLLSTPLETALRKGRSLPAHILSISIEQCRSLGLDVRHSPDVDNASPNFNLSHCLLHPADSSKTGVRDVREVFLHRATILHVNRTFMHRIRALVLPFHLRRRAALRLIAKAQRHQAS